MKLLLAHYRLPYPIYMSGADKANLEFLSGLNQLGVETEAMYCSGPHISLNQIADRLQAFGYSTTWNQNKLSFTTGSTIVDIYSPEHYFEAFNKKRPDWLWLHNPLFPVDLNSFFNGTKTFLYYQSLENIQCFKPFSENIQLKIANSEFLAELGKTEGNVVYPAPYPPSSFPEKTDDNFITMINPIMAKGGGIVDYLIRARQDLQFQLLYGWSTFPPKEFEFENYNNVVIHPPTLDLWQVYAKSKITLVPSQYPESFGRVPVESAMANVPSLVSDQGGLRESFVGNGALVKDYKNPEAWLEALEKMLQQKPYDDAIDCCKKTREKFNFSVQCQQLYTYLTTQ